MKLNIIITHRVFAFYEQDTVKSFADPYTMVNIWSFQPVQVPKVIKQRRKVTSWEVLQIIGFDLFASSLCYNCIVFSIWGHARYNMHHYFRIKKTTKKLSKMRICHKDCILSFGVSGLGSCSLPTRESSNSLLTAISIVHTIRAVEDILDISGESAWKVLDPEKMFSGILRK